MSPLYVNVFEKKNDLNCEMKIYEFDEWQYGSSIGYSKLSDEYED